MRYDPTRWMPPLLTAALAIATAAPPAHAGNGAVALQTAAPSCPDASGDTYVDCGNGTVTDNRSGLVWLADADCFGERTWTDAMAIVSGLADLSAAFGSDIDCELSDGSSPGEWRLPTLEELELMTLDGAAMGCDPQITNDAGDNCWTPLCAGVGTLCSISGLHGMDVEDRFWTATADVSGTGAHDFSLSLGTSGDSTKSTMRRVWAVRGGQ